MLNCANASKVISQFVTAKWISTKTFTRWSLVLHGKILTRWSLASLGFLIRALRYIRISWEKNFRRICMVQWAGSLTNVSYLVCYKALIISFHDLVIYNMGTFWVVKNSIKNLKIGESSRKLVLLQVNPDFTTNTNTQKHRHTERRLRFYDLDHWRGR